MFVSEAYAQTVGATSGGGSGFSIESLQQFLPIILIFVVFYFFMIRPQQKKMKAHREMTNNLRRGDRVLLQGGLFGQVAKIVSDAELLVEIADKVQVKVLRTAIAEVLGKTEPVSAAATPAPTPAATAPAAVEAEKPAPAKAAPAKTAAAKSSARKKAAPASGAAAKKAE